MVLMSETKNELEDLLKKQQPNRRTARPFSVLYWNPRLGAWYGGTGRGCG